MQGHLFIYNTLSRKKEKFEPLSAPFVGMYVCGPTVYSNAHLGNCRTYVSFDVIFRYLTALGFKVRYVRNITDAGHLESDADVGEDKVSKKAKLEQIEPMEIVQRYTNDFHEVLNALNTIPPSIEPTATGHITEQIEMTKKIIENGFAYVKDGSVYFDVEKYNQQKEYGILSNRKLEELLENTRDLDGQNEKKGRLDFALWIKAKPEHLMRWPSPWGWGFPGWHIECSAMSTKYLGEQFDIHGGGMDLIPTHHTNEIAQSQACSHTTPVKYWMHTNMLTVNGQKMSKSLGNSFLPAELFEGKHPLLQKGFSPMTVRFFMLQTHYRSTLDFSNEALIAAEKGYDRLVAAINTLENIKAAEKSTWDVNKFNENCFEAMNDDFNTPVTLAHLFEAVRVINSANDGKESLTAEDLSKLKQTIKLFVKDILGLKSENSDNDQTDILNRVLNVLFEIRNDAKSKKDFATSDAIRNKLIDANIIIKDGKDGSTTWALKQ